jgi:hypothetical protein
VLLATDLPFWHADSGATQRILVLARTLAGAGLETGVFYPARVSAADRATLAARAPGVTLHTPPWPLLALRALRRWAVALGGRRPHPALQPPLTWERHAAFLRCCHRLRPNAVVVEYARLGYLVAGLPAGIRRVVDTHDVLSLRTRRLREAGIPGDPGVSDAEEQAALAPFDAVVAIQDAEAAQLRAMLPGQRVLVAGHPPALAPFRFKTGAPVVLLFVGAGGAHNVATLERFLVRVWPDLRATLGDMVRLDVAGHVCEAFRDRVPGGVCLRGFTADLDAVYAEADVVINPCFAGSGLKIKNLEALAQGKPLVTTPLGAEGIEPGAPPAFQVCADDAAIKAALRALCTDATARRALAEAAHAHAAARLRPEAVFAELLDYLRGN